jgi:CRISPR/Cas system-associated exonuclease Cas4 (RecB family)
MEFTWSFSSLKEYVNCPKQYQETKVLKRFFKRVTPEMTYGNEVHKALENYVRDGTPLAENYKRFAGMLDILLAIEGDHYPEHRMALNNVGDACEYSGKDRWVRGIADLLIVCDDTAYIVDYKTGSNKYPDVKQLKLMALMTFAHFPDVNYIKAGLLFVAHDSFIDEEYKRSQIKELWNSFNGDLARMIMSYENDAWMPNPTPLCGWCPVRTCDYHKEK